MKIPSIICLFSLLIAVTGCASTDKQPVWPPAEKDVYTHVDVFATGLHSFVVLNPVPDEDSPYYREYGFADQRWYLERRQGLLNGLRALFLPTSSVVEMRQFTEEELHATYAQEEVPVWRFAVSRESYEAIEHFLHTWHDPDRLLAAWQRSRYFAGVRSYHFFQGCHHYTAGALKAGGIPMRPVLAPTRFLISRQLDRAERIQEDHL